MAQPDFQSRSLRGVISANTRWALTEDRSAATRPARDARLERFRQQVLQALPQLAGNEPELTRRAEQLRRADMARMSLKAAQARRLRATARKLEREAAQGQADLSAAADGR